MSNRALPIGIFDSGVGGLSVLRYLRQLLPQENFIYLGDTARTPYGTKSPGTILEYSRDCVSYLTSVGVKMIVVACNTASSIAVPILKKENTVPVIGMIEAAPHLDGAVCILGTKATIKSDAYQQRLNSLSPELRIMARPCPLFVPLVEEGLFEGEIVDSVIKMYLEDIRAETPDHLILACTHYPLLRGAIQRYFGLATTIIDCGEAASGIVKDILTRSDLLRSDDSPGQVSYRVTDDVERFKMVGRLFLGDVISDISLVNNLTR
jgi:glutamate racemase